MCDLDMLVSHGRSVVGGGTKKEEEEAVLCIKRGYGKTTRPRNGR